MKRGSLQIGRATSQNLLPAVASFSGNSALVVSLPQQKGPS